MGYFADDWRNPQLEFPPDVFYPGGGGMGFFGDTFGDLPSRIGDEISSAGDVVSDIRDIYQDLPWGGGKSTNEIATIIINRAEQSMQANLSLALSGQRSCTEGLRVFDEIWAAVLSQSGCGDPRLGDSGRRCISERTRGGIYDYFSAYRDPITQKCGLRAGGQPGGLIGIPGPNPPGTIGPVTPSLMGSESTLLLLGAGAGFLFAGLKGAAVGAIGAMLLRR